VPIKNGASLGLPTLIANTWCPNDIHDSRHPPISQADGRGAGDGWTMRHDAILGGCRENDTSMIIARHYLV